MWAKGLGGLDAIKWNFGAYFLFNGEGKFVEMLTGVPSKMQDAVSKVLGSPGTNDDPIEESPDLVSKNSLWAWTSWCHLCAAVVRRICGTHQEHQ